MMDVTNYKFDLLNFIYWSQRGKPYLLEFIRELDIFVDAYSFHKFNLVQSPSTSTATDLNAASFWESKFSSVSSISPSQRSTYTASKKPRPNALGSPQLSPWHQGPEIGLLRRHSVS